MKTLIARLVLVILVTVLSVPLFSQSAVKAQLEKAMEEKRFDDAEQILQNRLEFYFSAKTYDSIPHLVEYVGSINESRFNTDIAIQKINALIARLKSIPASDQVLGNTYSQASHYLSGIGLSEQAVLYSEQALVFMSRIPNVPADWLGDIHSNIGTNLYNTGNFSEAEPHYRKALVLLQSVKNPDFESIYIVQNNMGGMMWMHSKLDSAVQFYTQALNTLSKTAKTPINQYYRPAVVNNNISAIYNIQGNTTKAIDALTSTINGLKKYLEAKEDVPKKKSAVPFQFEAIDNLAGIYKELGNYAQAYQLLNYSYQQKQIHAGADKTGIYKSQILLGQLYHSMKDNTKALDFLNQGLDNIRKADGDFLFWQADACNTLADIYDDRNDIRLATHYYERADSLYEASLQGSYDNIYLEFLTRAAVFYAKNNRVDLAMSKAMKGHNYIVSTQGTETLPAFNQLLNVSEIHLMAGQYRQSLDASKKCIAIVEKLAGNSTNRLDSIMIELQKPKAIVVKAKAEYELLENKDVASLTALLQQLNGALAILERRKAIVQDSKDIGVLMAGHSSLLNFIKKITLDLHNLTKDQGYIDKLIELHESGIYSRIRSRLDKSDSIRFAHIPKEIQEREKQLKASVKSALEENDSHGKSMNAYFTALKEWEGFQEMVKKNYPHYYKLRYESILGSLQDVQRVIPANSSLVRYFFIDRDLFALVIDNNSRKLVALQSNGLENNVNVLTHYGADIDKTGEALFNLYNQLWAPIAQHIKHKKITIVPDGILYSLNFEVLTSKKIRSFDQLADLSLLAGHTISYHYSLYLVGQKREQVNVKDNFVAFAPGFLDEEKQRYRSSVRDSFQLDLAYVSLLPQPFAISFASRARNMLGGIAFINEESTVNSFKENAGKHKIIHIGTHAESNNLVPEFSRLIFSKTGVDGGQNSIFLHELYNCDLSSELAVLTACESGKPGFQDGEGMISLAHAFNYAGSESILTGLWKIDEKASAMLMEQFYANLVEGMDKDEALRQAKLEYLRTAKGRMLAPQYWAGLVLMGDTGSIELKKTKSANIWWWAMGGLIAVLVLLFVFRKTRRSGS